MKRTRFLTTAACTMFLLTACTARQQSAADQRAHEAGEDLKRAGREVKKGAERAANEIRAGARKLNAEASNATADVKPDTAHVDEKLHAAAANAKEAGREAADGADRLALTARVKSALANDVGAKTLTNISVSCSGSTVTLTGTVSSAADKQRAEQSASAVSGVSRVVNRIHVERPGS